MRPLHLFAAAWFVCLPLLLALEGSAHYCTANDHSPCPRPSVLALIPVRSGSKSVPDKNIKIIAGKPLVAHTIAQALASSMVTRVIVSTDSEKYRDVALKWGAEAPFLRPASLAEDLTPDWPVFDHALRWLEAHEGYRPLIVVHLRATCPLRYICL